MNAKGFGLVQVIFAMGLLSTIALGTSQFVSNMKYQQQIISSRLLGNTVTREIEKHLLDSANCRENFEGLDPSIIRAGNSSAIIEDIVDANGNPVMHHNTLMLGNLKMMNVMITLPQNAQEQLPVGSGIYPHGEIKIHYKMGAVETHGRMMATIVLDPGTGLITDCFSHLENSDPYRGVSMSSHSFTYHCGGNAGGNGVTEIFAGNCHPINDPQGTQNAPYIAPNIAIPAGAKKLEFSARCDGRWGANPTVWSRTTVVKAYFMDANGIALGTAGGCTHTGDSALFGYSSQSGTYDIPADAVEIKRVFGGHRNTNTNTGWAPLLAGNAWLNSHLKLVFRK